MTEKTSQSSASKPFGGRQHAVVIGAGMGGLAAAAALASHFERVTVLERDELPSEASPRPGTPQSYHPHGLLVGGQRALSELFPGFGEDLVKAGAIQVRGTLDLREERPGYNPFPQRDLGWIGHTMTRPLLELTTRRCLQKIQNVTVRGNCRALEIVAAPDGSVAAVRYESSEATQETIPVDIVVDASGRGVLTRSFLETLGSSLPDQTTIGVDITYASATFEMPEGTRDWKIVMTLPDMPTTDRGTGYLFPIEGNRWFVLVGGWHGKPASLDLDKFIEAARQLRTPTIYEAIKHAKPIGKIHGYAFPESLWRHYERLPSFPRGLIPIGDAICQFNPIYGQGMTVAAQEACLLRDLLSQRSGDKDPLAGLGEAFLSTIQPLIAAAWAMSAVPDFIFPQTRGERPADLERSLHFFAGLARLASRDLDIHKLMMGVRNLIESPALLHDPALVQRIQAEMAQAD